jgi:uncharacterized protein
MSSPRNLGTEQARRLVLDCQSLPGRETSLTGKQRTAEIIENLGYVQIDTISVVQRAHHHTLWTRYSGYQPDMLHQLQAVDRRIFEYWGHAASFLPMSDYRYYTHRMRNFSDPMDKWAKDRLKKCGHLMDDIHRRIREEGPLGSKDFKSNPDAKRGPWWDWKPAKTALELLFWRGDLMVTRRDNFQRIYDLTERVLPEGIDTSIPEKDELGRFLVRRALKAQGTATMNDIVQHIHAAGREIIIKAAESLVDSGEIVQLSIDGVNGFYSLAEFMENPPPDITKEVHILSPFDNLIIQRERTRRHFNFDYALECYTPKAKRRFGYFVLPVLWGTEFAARIDAKADRKRKVLLIRGLHIEDGLSDLDIFLPAFADKLAGFARFNNCVRIEFEAAKPGKIISPLKKILNNMKPETADA